MFIRFPCFCPLGLTIKLHFNISKGFYYTQTFQSVLVTTEVQLVSTFQNSLTFSIDFVNIQREWASNAFPGTLELFIAIFKAAPMFFDHFTLFRRQVDIIVFTHTSPALSIELDANIGIVELFCPRYTCACKPK